MIWTILKHVANVDDQNATFKMIGTILKYDFKIED
jgi:hypothetical protein